MWVIALWVVGYNGAVLSTKGDKGDKEHLTHMWL